MNFIKSCSAKAEKLLLSHVWYKNYQLIQWNHIAKKPEVLQRRHTTNLLKLPIPFFVYSLHLICTWRKSLPISLKPNFWSGLRGKAKWSILCAFGNQPKTHLQNLENAGFSKRSLLLCMLGYETTSEFGRCTSQFWKSKWNNST